MQEHSNNRRRLSDILAGRTDEIREQWDSTEAAADFAPLPAGTYECHVQAVELFNARTGTPGVKIQFRVADGEHTGRMVFHDLWLTPAALPQTKRDCGKLGIAQLEQLENGVLPPGRIRCKVRVALRTDDSGEQYIRVRRFDVLGVDEPEPEADPFAPEESDEATERQSGEGTKSADTDAAEASFDFGGNAHRKDAGATPQGDGAAPPEGGES